MTRSDFGKLSALAAAVLAMVLAGAFDAQAQQAIKNGDVLSGKLNAMRSRASNWISRSISGPATAVAISG